MLTIDYAQLITSLVGAVITFDLTVYTSFHTACASVRRSKRSSKSILGNVVEDEQLSVFVDPWISLSYVRWKRKSWPPLLGHGERQGRCECPDTPISELDELDSSCVLILASRRTMQRCTAAFTMDVRRVSGRVSRVAQGR